MSNHTSDDSVPSSIPQSQPLLRRLRSEIVLPRQTPDHPESTSISSLRANEIGDVTLSPGSMDRVFPIRTAVSVDASYATPALKTGAQDSYFSNANRADKRRISANLEGSAAGSSGSVKTDSTSPRGIETNGKLPDEKKSSRPEVSRENSRQIFNELVTASASNGHLTTASDQTTSPPPTMKSAAISGEDGAGLLTARFKHVVTADGHAVITGRDGDTIQRCEDEPIHIPGAIQKFGLLIALQEDDGKYVVRVVSENSESIIGYSPKALFALDSFTDILAEEQADNLLDHLDFIKDENEDVSLNGPEVFTLSIRPPEKRNTKLWCAMHVNEKHPDLIICEFELEDDTMNPIVPPAEMEPPAQPEDTLNSNPTEDEYATSTNNFSRPLRVLRSARKRKGEAAAMEVFNILSQVQEQLASAPTLEMFLKVLVGVVKELTGFHRVMVYQFDPQWNGRVVTELLDPRHTKDLYHGLNFPASDIPQQARELYKVNRVRLLYDRDQETARLVCRTTEDLAEPLDLTHSYLRAMSPIHIKYLANMAVRSSMSISINAFNELWGLVSLHSYGSHGMRVAFPIRKMCRLVGDTASRNIERLSYASRLQARRLINTTPTAGNPSGYIVASSEDLLKLFDADFGMLSIKGETKILGHIEQTQEALAMLEYLRICQFSSVRTSSDIAQDFPDLVYPPGFNIIGGILFVPLSTRGNDFIVFFRKTQLKEVKWAGNPYEKFVKQGTEGYLEPRKSFKTWRETVVGKGREWSQEEVETAAVLCLVYGKFIEVWRQKEISIQNTELTRLLLANSAHEVRTPLNAIINYLEIALEGSLDQETRENLSKSHSASKSLIYVINDLLDLTKTEEGAVLNKGEVFDLFETLHEATDPYIGDAKRKGIRYDVFEHEALPRIVMGDQRRVRQAITNVCANAIKYTNQGSVRVEMYPLNRVEGSVHVEVAVQDTGIGMNDKQLDSLFADLEQVHLESINMTERAVSEDTSLITAETGEKRILGLGLAIVARIVRNMNGQLRLKSEAGKGSRFVIQFPFDLPSGASGESDTDTAKLSPHGSMASQEVPEDEVTLIAQDATRPASLDLTRVPHMDSMKSRKSFRSRNSSSSVHSARSDVDRLIEAIQEPHFADGSSSSSSRPRLEQRRSFTGGAHLSPSKRYENVETASAGLPDNTLPVADVPGQAMFKNMATPIKAVRMPDPLDSPVLSKTSAIGQSGTILGEPGSPLDKQDCNSDSKLINAHNMHVLVAEDDLINSRIVKKRLERLGHVIHLTGNGEECAGSYCDQSERYDVVLMDMQMPIVDGLTATKMIRSHEKVNSAHKLSKRAGLNHRVPIIAVSASLIEKERQTYIDAGFDAWILKPIHFSRLAELMGGIVDQNIRRSALYQPGQWEKGGWFDMPVAKVQAHTKPDVEKIGRNVPLKEEIPMKDRSALLDLGHVTDVNTHHTIRGPGKMPQKSNSAPPRLVDGVDGATGDDDIPIRPIFSGEAVASPAAIE